MARSNISASHFYSSEIFLFDDTMLIPYNHDAKTIDLHTAQLYCVETYGQIFYNSRHPTMINFRITLEYILHMSDINNYSTSLRFKHVLNS